MSGEGTDGRKVAVTGDWGGGMAEPRGWVHCHDPFGRDRSMTVIVENDHVLLVSPPGESAVLSATQTRRLRTLLDEVADDPTPRAPARRPTKGMA